MRLFVFVALVFFSFTGAWGGIIVLLVFLLTMNIIAIILRRRFERRW